MAWSTPMTAVANEIFTAAQFNTFVRDNLLETAPAKATAANAPSMFLNIGGNTLRERPFSTNFTDASDTTSSTTYVNIGTAITLTHNTQFGAMVLLGARVTNDTVGQSSFMSVRVIDSGTLAEVVAPSDTRALGHNGLTVQRCQAPPITLALSAGSYQFQLRYRVTGGIGTFQNRWLGVFPT